MLVKNIKEIHSIYQTIWFDLFIGTNRSSGIEDSSEACSEDLEGGFNDFDDEDVDFAPDDSAKLPEDKKRASRKNPPR